MIIVPSNSSQRRVAPSLSSDFATRIADTNVVWYHDFNDAAEVNRFRWTSGYSGGNDPNGSGTNAANCSHVASGGVDGGGFLRLSYPLGSSPNSVYWWRPFNPLTGATNGRGTDDPGANGSLSAVAWSVTDGSQTTNRWTLDQSNPGWYGHANSVAANPTKFHGTDFYLQVRVRRTGKPGPPPDASPYTSITGKSVWLSTTNASYTAQELVTYGQSVGNGDTNGVFERHNVYNAGYGSFYSLADIPFDPTRTTVNTTVDWRYSGGWDTLLYHITPGTQDGTGSNRTRVEIWAQHDPSLYPAETGVYTKIWDVLYQQDYDVGTGPAGGANLPGWNALLLAIYHNGSVFTTTAFNFDYDQVIFSKATIAAPTVQKRILWIGSM